MVRDLLKRHWRKASCFLVETAHDGDKKVRTIKKRAKGVRRKDFMTIWGLLCIEKLNYL